MRLIKKKNKVIVQIFDGKFEEGTKPLTEENLALQVLGLKHSKGKVLAAHAHKPVSRTTERLMEMLLVISGKIKLDIYYQKEFIESVVLSAGQGALVLDGGIGIKILEDAEMLEFKNGPFIEDKILL